MKQGIKKTTLYRVSWLISYIFIIVSIFLLNRGVSSVRTVGFLLFVALGAVLPLEELLVLLAILEPVGILFKFKGSFTVMPFLFILLFLKLFIRKNKLSGKKLIPLFALMIISGINYLFRGFNPTDYIAFFTMLMCFVWMSELKSIDMKTIFEKIVWLYVFSVLIECILSTRMPAAVKMVTTVSEYAYRTTGFSSPWNYGRHIVVAVAFLIYWILVKRNNIVISALLIVFLIFYLINTGLFSSLIALAVLLAIIPFSFDGTLRERIGYMLFVSIICFLGLVAAYYWVYRPMLGLRGEISDNGRFAIWGAYCQDFISNPSIMAFGVGAGAISGYAASVNRLTTHSVVIEKLFELGVIGVISLSYLLYQCFSMNGLQVRKNRRVLPMIAFLGTCLTQGVTGNELIYILMMLTL